MKRISLIFTLLSWVALSLLITSCDNNTDDETPTTDLPEVVITDDQSGTGTTTWTKENVYVLDGFVFVNEGQTLTIEAGTVIKGLPGSGENASALVVARGGKIIAEGTADEPIIFTAYADDLTRTDDLPAYARGLWGGLIVCGKAGLNSTPGESAVEGIPTSEPRGLYGGSDDADNSGILKYVSIRHGGSEIGAGNEINGLTLAGVGSGTEVDYIEVFANLDDGVEWFGGTVNAKHLMVSFCGDDCFDYDEGFRGKGQFWVAMQWSDAGDRGGEHDGGTDPEDGNPYATPVVYNATYVGGLDGDGDPLGDRCIYFRDNAGGKYYNSVFMNFAAGVKIEDLSSGEDSRARLDAGDLVLANNIWYNIGDDAIETIASGDQYTIDHLAANNNTITNPGLGDTDVSDRTLDLTPTSTSSATHTTAVATPADAFFTTTSYNGAFDVNDSWADWTIVKQLNILQ